MKIYFVRHAYPDFETGGTIGKAQAEAVALFLVKENLNPQSTLVLSSPLDRAQQTARIIQQELSIESVSTETGLVLDAHEDILEIAHEAGKKSQATAVIVVSHLAEIDHTLKDYANDIGASFEPHVSLVSVHYIDTEKKEIKKLFELPASG